MKKLFITTLVCLALFACKKKDLSVKLNESFTLNFEQSAMIDSENLEIKFADVNDSRCAEGAQCVWAGEGLVTLLINETSIDVSTLQPLDTLGYTFSIIDLSPYPSLDKEIKKKDYELDLVVAK